MKGEFKSPTKRHHRSLHKLFCVESEKGGEVLNLVSQKLRKTFIKRMESMVTVEAKLESFLFWAYFLKVYQLSGSSYGFALQEFHRQMEEKRCYFV